MTGIYITIIILALKLIWDWQRVRKRNKQISVPSPQKTDIKSYVQFMDFFPSEDIPKHISYIWNKEDFENSKYSLYTEDSSEKQQVPLSQRKIEIQKLEALLLKYPLEKRFGIAEEGDPSTLTYANDATKLFIEHENGIVHSMYLHFIKAETGPWLVEVVHEMGNTWNLSASLDDALFYLVDLRNKEQIQRYFSTLNENNHTSKN